MYWSREARQPDNAERFIASLVAVRPVLMPSDAGRTAAAAELVGLARHSTQSGWKGPR